MKGGQLSLFVLGVALLLGVAAGGNHGAQRGAKRMMRQGDALSRLRETAATAPPGLGDGKALEASAVHRSKVLSQRGLKEKDKITNLPGQPGPVLFNQYGGYVTVDKMAGRALFYYFTEAPDATSMPLLLWLNGGPGCSSFGYGAMEELGPFRVKSDGKTLFRNPYAWNRVANVLFLESPAGVGFSYSNTTSDYQMSGDARTAEDAYVFLVNWLERFPEYKSRDFYIAGESYAGHYVPQLAHTIHQYNQLPHATLINLKGIAIGNAVINDLTDDQGMYDFFWSHGLSSDENHQAILENCDFKYEGGTKNAKCQAAVAVAEEVLTQVDIYNIYGPLCFNNSLTAFPKRASVKNFDPCTDNYVFAYLNDPEVQKALHANVTKISDPWMACSNLPWQDTVTSVLPLLKEFIQNGIRVWVYSGDVDGRVPVTSSRYSVSALGLPVKTPWLPWIAADEVAGYSEVYKGGLTLATVRGAGHEVPSFQAMRSLVLIESFLQGKPLPPYPT